MSAVSVMSGKIAERARTRWAAAGLEPITLHECRHTYASFLMAAGYTLRELMEYMGHSSLQATERYVKLLDRDEIVLRRLGTGSGPLEDRLAVIDQILATASPRPAGTTDRWLTADREG